MLPLNSEYCSIHIKSLHINLFLEIGATKLYVQTEELFNQENEEQLINQLTELVLLVSNIFFLM